MKTDPKQGALLLIVIVGLLASSVLGTALLAMATSARYQRLHVVGPMRAYYLAESGGMYARLWRSENPGQLPGGHFQMANGDWFELESWIDAGKLMVRSLGVAFPNTTLEARRQLTIEITERRHPDVLPVGFDFDEDGVFDADYWTAINVDPRIRETGPSGGQAALDLRGEQGAIQLNWTGHPELNLQRVWAYNQGLLSYDVQVKIKPFDTGQQAAYSKHYLLGITFRLRETLNKAYGLSFFRSDASNHQAPQWAVQLPAAMQALRGTNIYVVLWHGFEPMELMAYRQLTPADGAFELRNGLPELRDYSTLLLELKEKMPDGVQRRNEIRAYLEDTGRYPLWTQWDDMEWQDHAQLFPAPITWDDGRVTITDSRITSEDFPFLSPAEIGIHVFYDRRGANLKFFDDFAIRMEGYGASMGGDQIQY
jgi:hypothetical protein